MNLVLELELCVHRIYVSYICVGIDRIFFASSFPLQEFLFFGVWIDRTLDWSGPDFYFDLLRPLQIFDCICRDRQIIAG